MKTKSTLSSMRELKKISYRILRKMHDLERKKKRETILSHKTSSNEIYLLLALEHLCDLLIGLLTQIDVDRYVDSSIQQYVKRLERFRVEVERNVKGRKSLKKGLTSKLLQSHTKVFNRLLEDRVLLDLNERYVYLWAKAIQAAVAVWGNNI